MMTASALVQTALLGAITLVAMIPLGAYIARLFSGEPVWLDRLSRLRTIENASAPMPRQNWKQYALSLLIFNGLGILLLWVELAFQDYFPLNPRHLPGLSWDLALNVAISFVTNTDWQAYSGEQTLTYFSQMVGLTVENFLSASTGLVVAIAMIRGLTNKESPFIGNFYDDLWKATLYLLLPLSLLFAVFLVSQGTPENFKPYLQAIGLEGKSLSIPQGPVASQVAIKLLGSNGGGYFGANGAHPYENPTPLTNIAEMVSILLLPGALIIAFGRMIGDRRQAWALLASMTILFLIAVGATASVEINGNPRLTAMGVDQTATDSSGGGNMEGKEVRFGPVASALFAVTTTATSNGTTNAQHESLMPIAEAAVLFNMLIGEVVYGGIGCGLYGMMIYVLVTVFIAGLMVGRTPEYLGKKIETVEIKLAVIAMLIYPLTVLGFGSLALILPSGLRSLSTNGPHGLTQMMYAYASAAANNGSAFGGLNANTVFENLTLGAVMLIGRYGIIFPSLAISGSLARKRTIPVSSGTFPTHGLMFILLLTGTIILFGGLTYFPVLALGPLIEHLNLAAIAGS